MRPLSNMVARVALHARAWTRKVGGARGKARAGAEAPSERRSLLLCARLARVNMLLEAMRLIRNLPGLLGLA